MLAQELRALGDLAGEASGGLSTRIEELHSGIAQRAFAGVGEAAAPVRAIHDRIATGMYAAVGAALRGSIRAGARAASLTQAPEARSIERSPAGRLMIGAINGAFGDRLSESGNALAVEMAVARPISNPSPKVAVFLHGLCETEDAWWLGAGRHRPYGERLRSELGFTPVYIRYNSGRSISDSGRDLARLLEQLTEAWPVKVEEIALIGHSMGGLVARCACQHGIDDPWTELVRHVFMLGTPHRGAPLAKAADKASARLTLLPETVPLANALNLRSAGIKDLCLDCDVPFLRTANHYFVSATLTLESGAPAGRLVGDLLVLAASAWDHGGRGQQLMFPLDHYRHLGGANHFDLLNHPAVYEQIRQWLVGRAALPVAA